MPPRASKGGKQRRLGPEEQRLRREGWALLNRLRLNGDDATLSLRHNSFIQRKAVLLPRQPLGDRLAQLASECNALPKERPALADAVNPRITGAVKVAEHTHVDGLKLIELLRREMRKAARHIVAGKWQFVDCPA